MAARIVVLCVRLFQDMIGYGSLQLPIFCCFYPLSFLICHSAIQSHKLVKYINRYFYLRLPSACLVSVEFSKLSFLMCPRNVSSLSINLLKPFPCSRDHSVVLSKFAGRTTSLCFKSRLHLPRKISGNR